MLLFFVLLRDRNVKVSGFWCVFLKCVVELLCRVEFKVVSVLISGIAWNTNVIRLFDAFEI